MSPTCVKSNNSRLICAAAVIIFFFSFNPILKAVWSEGRLVTTTFLNKLQHKMSKNLITGSPAGKQQGLKSTGAIAVSC